MSSGPQLPAIDIATFSVFADGLDHPECVVWDADERLVYAGGEAGQIYAVDEAGLACEIAAVSGTVLGLALDDEGRIYACAGSAVWRVDRRNASTEVYSQGTQAIPMRLPNYPTFGLDGSLYVTDSGGWDEDDGLLYRVRPDRTTEVWETSLTAFPNGTALSESGDALYVVQSQDPGVWRVPIQADGAAGTPSLFCELPGSVPDGLAWDSRGHLYVGCYRPDQIVRIDGDGEAELLAFDPRGHLLSGPTNLAFAGAPLDRLACASIASRHISTVDLGAVGRPVPRPRVLC